MNDAWRGMAAFALMLVALLVMSPACAYPDRPVRFLVPYPPGGSQDVIARVLAQRLTERFGQQVVVDNRSGASGLIATEATARAAPDGHTIMMVNAGPITIAPHVQKKLSFDPMKDLVPVTQLYEIPSVLVVNLQLPVRSVQDLIAYAKANPGKLNYASPGNGSPSHLTMEFFKMHTGVQATHIPYKGAVPAFIDIMSGQVAMIFISAGSAQPFTSVGKARPLAVAGKNRTGMMPDVPTMAEAGVKNFELPVWVGASTTAGTPRAIIDRLNREFHAVLAQPEVKERLAQLGSEVVVGTPEQFGAMLKEDLARWGKLIRTANLKLD